MSTVHQITPLGVRELKIVSNRRCVPLVCMSHVKFARLSQTAFRILWPPWWRKIMDRLTQICRNLIKTTYNSCIFLFIHEKAYQYHYSFLFLVFSKDRFFITWSRERDFFWNLVERVASFHGISQMLSRLRPCSRCMIVALPFVQTWSSWHFSRGTDSSHSGWTAHGFQFSRFIMSTTWTSFGSYTKDSLVE